MHHAYWCWEITLLLGAGKVLGGITLVVFPLTALMDEQAHKLRSYGQKVLVLHSGIEWKDQIRGLTELYHGQQPDFVFISPERIATDGFLQFVMRKRRYQIKLVVVDEIHCVSQWGLDFRPFYKEIPHFLSAVFSESPTRPPILGLTATLNPRDTDEICSDFGIDSANVLKSNFLLRLNIRLDVEKVPDENTKDNLFWSKLEQHKHEKVLVYVENKRSGPRGTEEMCERALSIGMLAAYFHADMESSAKADVIRQFKAGAKRTVFATSAFGMGIDIPDIRGVIHYRPPESIEQYYQQVGRIGRDGKAAWAHLYWSDKNIDFRKRQFIDKSFPEQENIQESFATLTKGKGDIKSFNYFQESDAQSAYHYLLHSQVVSILCKGVQSLDVFAPRGTNAVPGFDGYLRASPTKLVVAAASRLHIPVEQITADVYSWLASRQIEAKRTPSKCLFIRQNVPSLPQEIVDTILQDVETKKQFRYEQIDNLVALLETYSGSTELHQSIGRYLGIDEFQLSRIHETLSGTYVRSKSEVIIANLLTNAGIPFEYERKLRAAGQMMLPDFTIQYANRCLYWAHLGMLDDPEYRQRWEEKRTWYERNFAGDLITTEDSPTLSRTAEDIIRTLILSAGASERASEDANLAPTTVALPEVQPVANQTSVPAEQTCHVLVLTEGQTDWKHLQAALSQLKQRGKFQLLELEFQTDELDTGDTELLRICRQFARLPQPHCTVCLFDRDNVNTVRDVVSNDKSYKHWGNRVYSVALPIPEHRQSTPNICIEFYYKDEDIQRVDSNGRRLYIGTEFSSRTVGTILNH